MRICKCFDPSFSPICYYSFIFGLLWISIGLSVFRFVANEYKQIAIQPLLTIRDIRSGIRWTNLKVKNHYSPLLNCHRYDFGHTLLCYLSRTWMFNKPTSDHSLTTVLQRIILNQWKSTLCIVLTRVNLGQHWRGKQNKTLKKLKETAVVPNLLYLKNLFSIFCKKNWQFIGVFLAQC
jgi:hypothetical protein